MSPLTVAQQINRLKRRKDRASRAWIKAKKVLAAAEDALERAKAREAAANDAFGEAYYDFVVSWSRPSVELD